MKDLNKEIRALEGRTLEGLIHAVIELQREAEPGTPVDLGNLRASWFSVSFRGQEETGVGIVEFKGEQSGVLKADHQKVTQAALSAAKSLGNPSQPIVIFGYTANYAVFVHENVGAKFNRPTARARWLYKAMQSAKGRMLEQIRIHARFK